jgi:nucleoside diphosphate kinase
MASKDGKERTVALLKPDVVGRAWTEDLLTKAATGTGGVEDDAAAEQWEASSDVRGRDKASAILDRIKAAGFTIVSQRMVQFTPQLAHQFYAEHAGEAEH